MFSRRYLFTRVLATLLPFCLVWGFVACVSLCASHDEEAHENTAYHVLTANMGDSHGGEHCPIPATPICGLPERQSNAPAPQVSGDVQASFAPSPSPTGFALRVTARQLNPPSTSDPPLDRLGVLRI